VVPQWFTLPHQINATLPNIVADDTAYTIMRAVQFLLPGEPQVYYVGLFNGMDDRELFAKTANGRDTNRHNYTPAEIEAALATPVPQAIIGLARIRRHELFENGQFSWAITGADSMNLTWTNATAKLTLDFKTTVGAPSFVIELAEGGSVKRAASVEELAAW
jgi:sucrose phosphorylase